MDWLRRNWPDLLIGIALIAVIAGIVATLLTGGSFFPIDTGSNPPPSVTSPTVDPVPPTTDPGVPGGGVQATPPGPEASTPEGAADGGEATTPGNGGAVAVLPPTADADTQTPGGDAAAGSPANGAGANAPPAVASTPATTPATPARPATPGNEGLPTEPYRVSVGAFGSEENAQRQAARFRDAGFPVFIGRQADLFLVLVGPYDTEAQAEQAVAQIRNGDFGIDPVIYLFQPDAPGAAGATVAPESSTAAAGAEGAPAPAAGTGGTYLQVGAYGTRESALPQIERLEELGFGVTERTEDGLLRLLVGPFSGEDLSEAREVLQEAGIEHFARPQ